MTKKNIKNILNKKFNAWINSIEDTEVKELVRKNTIITGGAIVSLLLNEKPNDYDIYFKDKETTQIVAEYYAELYNENSNGKNEVEVVITPKEEIPEKLNIDIDRIEFFISSDGIEVNEEDNIDEEEKQLIEDLEKEVKEKPKKRKKYYPIFFSSNAVTLSNKIQIIVRFYGDPDEIHENYDYIHDTCYWTSWNNKLVLPPKALESIVTKKLYYCGSKYPLASLFRLRKFIKRGWSISAGQLFKIIWQINMLDLQDIGVLKEQLVGADISYFYSLIRYLEENIDISERDKFDIDTVYLSEIIDTIFED